MVNIDEFKEGRVTSETNSETSFQIERTKEQFRFPEQRKITLQIIKSEESTYESKDFDQEAEERLAEAEEVLLGDAHGSGLKILETAILSELATMPDSIEISEGLAQGIEVVLDVGKGGDEKNIIDNIFNEGSLKQRKASFKELYFSLCITFETLFEVEDRGGYRLADIKKNETVLDSNILSNDEVKYIATLFKKIKEKLEEYIDQIEWTGEDRELVLLGDNICDRSGFDDITMSVISKLQEKGSVSICAGNHDLNILAYANKKLSKISSTSFGNIVQEYSFLRSLCSIDENGNLEIGDKHEPADQYKDYLENSQLFYYDEKTNTFMSHARIDRKIIEGELGHRGGFKSKEEIKQFVDRANEWYQDIIKKVFNSSARIDTQLLQDLKKLSKIVNARRTLEKVPFEKVDQYVHGHDSSVSHEKYLPNVLGNDSDQVILNLDNEDRKARSVKLMGEFSSEGGAKEPGSMNLGVIE